MAAETGWEAEPVAESAVPAEPRLENELPGDPGGPGALEDPVLPAVLAVPGPRQRDPASQREDD